MSLNEVEKLFRHSLRNGIKDPKLKHLHLKLRQHFELELLTSYDQSLFKNTETNLWKLVHYKIIEEYRKKLKTLVHVKDEYSKVVGEFRAFLTEALGFYLRFITKINVLFGVDFKIIQEFNLVLQDQTEALSNIQVKPPSAENRIKLNMTVFRSLIYLGDLGYFY
jgi:hypothetical protein